MWFFNRKKKPTSVELIMINNLMEICQDSINLINSTSNPEVFFSRWDLLNEKLRELVEYEKKFKGIIKGEQPSELLIKFQKEKESCINDLINRSMNKAITEANKLKTETGKTNRIKKYFSQMEEYVGLMADKNVEILRNAASDFQHNIGDDENISKQALSTKQKSDSLINLDIDKELSIMLENGLYPGEIILLNWYRYGNKLTTDLLPQYFFYTYGIDDNNPDFAKNLLANGFLSISDPIESLQAFKVDELKKLLKAHNLKVGGRKQELINRLIENIPENDLEKIAVRRTYILTEKGRQVLEEYKDLIYIHQYYSNNNTVNVASFLRHYRTSKTSENVVDICYDLFYQAFLKYYNNKDYGIARNNILGMGQLAGREENYEDALTHYIKVFIYDVSGMNNNNRIFPPDNYCIAPAIISFIESACTELEIGNQELEERFNKIWDKTREELPFSYLDKEDSFECLSHSLKDIEKGERYLENEWKNSFENLSLDMKKQIIPWKYLD